MEPIVEEMDGVRESTEGFPVRLGTCDERLHILAVNEGGCNLTSVDLLDLLQWLRVNKPELLARP